MATQQSDNINIPYHKRIAMGEKLDGTSLQSKGTPQKGALKQAQPKKK